SAPSGETPGSRPGLGAVLGRVLSLRTPATGAKPGRWSGFSRMLFVLLIFMLGVQLVYYGLVLLATKVPGLQLNQPVAAQPTVPVLGSMPRWEALFWVIAIVGYILLYRSNLMPKDPMGLKARAEERANAAQPIRSARPATRAGRRTAARQRDVSA